MTAGAEADVRLLGDIEVRVGGRPVAIGHARQRAVFAVLVIETDRCVPVDELVDRVWAGQRLPSDPVGAVRTYVSLLRRAFRRESGPAHDLAIARQPGGYRVLAAALAGQGRLDEAAELLDRAMRTCREAVPPRRYELAVQVHSLASIDQSAGRAVTAEARYREALRLKEELLGLQHPEVALVLHNLATLLCAGGRTAEAAQCWSRALPIVAATYPADHPIAQTVRTAAAGS